MTIANQARNLAISIEAKKDALAQRQSGDWKVSFTVQSIDMDPRLTQAPMGTRFAMVLVEIGDDEQPVNRVIKRDWRDLPPAQQAGIRSDEATFAAFLKEERPDDWHEASDDPAECIRLICGVKSRSELGTNQKARMIWTQLNSQYEAWKLAEHA